MKLAGPGVQHGGHAEGGTEAILVAAEFEKGLRGRLEQKSVEGGAVAAGDRLQFARYGEDGVEVRHGQDPILAKEQEEPLAEHDVAVLLPLSLANPKHHSPAIEVGAGQVAGFADPKPSAVGSREDCPVLERDDCPEELLDLCPAQNVGKRLGNLGPGHMVDNLWATQRDLVEIAKRGDVHFQR